MWLKIQISSWGFRSISQLSVLPNLPSFFLPARMVLDLFSLREVASVMVPAIPLTLVLRWGVSHCHPANGHIRHNLEVLAPAINIEQITHVLLLPLHVWATLACSNTQPTFSSTNLLRPLQTRLVPSASRNSCLQIFLHTPLHFFKNNLCTPYIILNWCQKIFIICLISYIFCDAYRLWIYLSKSGSCILTWFNLYAISTIISQQNQSHYQVIISIRITFCEKNLTLFFNSNKYINAHSCDNHLSF